MGMAPFGGGFGGMGGMGGMMAPMMGPMAQPTTMNNFMGLMMQNPTGYGGGFGGGGFPFGGRTQQPSPFPFGMMGMGR
jgi:hypothetical protein